MEHPQILINSLENKIYISAMLSLEESLKIIHQRVTIPNDRWSVNIAYNFVGLITRDWCDHNKAFKYIYKSHQMSGKIHVRNKILPKYNQIHFYSSLYDRKLCR